MPKPFPRRWSSSPVPRTVRRGRNAALVTLFAGLAVLPAAASADTGGAEAGSTTATPAASTQPAAARSAPAAKTGRALVGAVQQKLHLKSDGVLGSQTRAAVRRFQRRHGLKVTGHLGADTLAAMGISAPAAAPATTTTAPAASGDAAEVLAAIAQCESGGDPTSVSSDGRYRGKYQFLEKTWTAIGGSGDPAAASETEQDERAASLYAAQGTAPWPVCGKQAAAAAS